MAAMAARSGGTEQGRHPPEPKGSSKVTAATVRISSLFLPILGAAIIVCAIAGLVVVGLNDSRRTGERHAALRLALDEVRAVFGAGTSSTTASFGSSSVAPASRTFVSQPIHRRPPTARCNRCTIGMAGSSAGQLGA